MAIAPVVYSPEFGFVYTWLVNEVFVYKARLPELPELPKLPLPELPSFRSSRELVMCAPQVLDLYGLRDPACGVGEGQTRAPIQQAVHDMLSNLRSSHMFTMVSGSLERTHDIQLPAARPATAS